jgi:hypothetical protein
MIVGLQLTVSPVDGDAEVVRFTVAVNPFLPVMVIVKAPVFPAGLNERLAELIVNGDIDPLM